MRRSRVALGFEQQIDRRRAALAWAVLRLALLVFGLTLQHDVIAAGALEQWRSDADKVRRLAENDAPAAYEQAQRLQAELPADATPADQAKALNLRARIEIYLALTEPAAQHGQRAFELAKKHGDRVGQAEADLNIALNSVNQGKLDDHAAAATHGLAILEGMDRPDLLGEALLRTSVMYRRFGQIEESVALAVQAMEIARRSKNNLALAYAHQGLAISYDQSGRYTEAQEHYRQMREHGRLAQSKLVEAYALAGIASTTGDLGDLAEAESLIRQSLELFRSVGTPFNVNFGLFALANNLRLQGRLVETLPILDGVIATYERYPNKIGLWYTLNARSANQQSLGNLTAAQTDAEKAYALAQDVGFTRYLTESTQILAALAAARGDFHQAYQLSTEAAELTAKAAREKSSARMLELAQRYESESRQREIEELTRRNQQQTAELQQRTLEQRWLWTVLIGSFAMLVGTAYFLFRLRRSHRLLEAVNSRLTTSQNDLQQQTGILQSILDSMGDGVAVADERGELLLLNPAAESVLGIGLSPGGPATWAQHYGLYETDQTTLYPTDELPLAKALRGISCDNVEIFVRNPSQQEGRVVNVTARPLTDKAGVARGGVAVFSDVTERKRAEEEIRSLNTSLEQRVQARTAELRQQTRYLRTLLDMLPWLAWLKDTGSRYLAVNQATADTCGLQAEEMVGKSDLEIWPRELADFYRADDSAVMASRQRTTVEERLADTRGDRWIETYKAPVLDEDGTVLGTVGVARDISERKAAEAAQDAALAEAERLAQVRSDFLAQMSHELRTPLNGILGYAHILRRDGDLTERQAVGVNVIQQSGEHLLTLINDILDFAKIEAGRLELNVGEIDLDKFLRVITSIVRIKAEQKGLNFAVETSADLPVAIQGDNQRLRQVLLNLLDNAIKFTDHGSVTLRVKPISPTCLRFEVQDTGIGIDTAHFESIFRPFEQTGEIQRRASGTGLGLAISNQLVHLMGGGIRLESQLGHGSTFSFDLAFSPARVRLGTEERHWTIVGYEGVRKKILVVDDIVENRSVAVDMLRRLGFDMLEAADGQEGLDIALSQRPDLILMDIVMPRTDGLEAIRRLRQLPDLKRVPIIAISASASSSDEGRSLQEGANAFLPKPIDWDHLLLKMAEFLKLAWTHEPPQHASERGHVEALDIPPAQEMETLHRLAQHGNMRDITEWADRIAQLDGQRYRSFASKLRRLAEGYQSKAILGLVEQHLRGGPPP